MNINHPLGNSITEHYHNLNARLYSTNELDDLLVKNKNNKIATIAISFVYISQYPKLSRGYLTAYDELYAMGCDSESLDVLYSTELMRNFHPLLTTRLLKRYCAYHDYKSAYDLLLSIPQRETQSLLKTNGVDNIINNLSIFFSVETLFDHYNIPQEKRKHACIDFNYPKTLEGFEHAKHDKNFDQAARLSVYLENKHGNNIDFYRKMCEPFENELDISSRVRYFTIQAGTKFLDADLICKAAYSYLYSNEIGKANDMIIKAINADVINDKLARLAIKSLSLKSIELSFLEGVFLRNDKHVSKRSTLFLKNAIVNNNIRNKRFGKLDRNHTPPYENKKLIFPKIYRDNVNTNVAICISGQLRGFTDNASRLQKNLVGKNSTTYFIDTWEKASLSNSRFNRVNRFIGNELFNLLPNSIKMPVDFMHTFPSLTKELTKPLTFDINNEFIKNLVPGSITRIENELIFEENVMKQNGNLKHRGNFNQAKMYYKISQCNDLMNQYSVEKNINFDVVIRIRPDLDISIDNLDDYIEFAKKNKNIVLISYPTAFGYGDQFAIGSKYAMDIYSSVWKLVSQSSSFKYCESFDDYAEQHVGEALLANHLLYQGIKCVVIKLKKANLVDPLAINALPNLSSIIESDLKQSKYKHELKNFLNKYKEFVDNHHIFK